MPEYKKKKVKKSNGNVKNTYTDEIKMTPKEPKPAKEKKKKENTVKTEPQTSEKKPIRVVRGNKLRNKMRRRIVLLVSVVLVVVFIILSVNTPTGMFEFLQNTFAARGSGSGFPSTITGGSLINTVQMNNVFITVTPTQVNGFNTKSGKSVFSYSHGYERPIVATSEARFMIYSQGEKQYSVYNFEKELISGETENDILTASIGRNGTFAIATKSDGYSSEVAVYNKKGKKIYKWFCADYIINDIEVTDNGKKLVLSAIYAQKGAYVSKLVVLDFDSATPVYSKVFENELILNLNSYNSKIFYAAFENKIEFFNWKAFENMTFELDKDIYFDRTTSKNALFVAGHNSNKNSNTVYIFNKKGEKVSEFNINFEVLDIAFEDDYIYILSDKVIYLYSVDGEQIDSVACSFGVVRVLPISHHYAIALTDNSADKIEIE